MSIEWSAWFPKNMIVAGTELGLQAQAPSYPWTEKHYITKTATIMDVKITFHFQK